MAYAQEVTVKHSGLVNISALFQKIGIEKKREYDGKEIASAGLADTVFIPLRPWKAINDGW